MLHGDPCLDVGCVLHFLYVPEGMLLPQQRPELRRRLLQAAEGLPPLGSILAASEAVAAAAARAVLAPRRTAAVPSLHAASSSSPQLLGMAASMQLPAGAAEQASLPGVHGTGQQGLQGLVRAAVQEVLGGAMDLAPDVPLMAAGKLALKVAGWLGWQAQ